MRLRSARRIPAAVGLVALALASGGCSSSPSPPSPRGPSAAAMSAVLLRPGDVPSGWTALGESSTSAAQISEAASQIPDCRAFVAATGGRGRRLERSGPSFKSPQGWSPSRSTLSNVVVGYRNEELATAAYAAASGGRAEGCLKLMFGSIALQAAQKIEQQAGLAPAVTSRVVRAKVPRAGDAASAFVAALTIRVGSREQDLGFELEFVRLGPYLVTYEAKLYAPLPDGAFAAMVASSMRRLEVAGGLRSPKG